METEGVVEKGSAAVGGESEATLLGDAARFGGASEKDIRSAQALGEVDAADDKVDQQFAKEGRGDEQSPIAVSIWGTTREAVRSLLFQPDLTISADAQQAVPKIKAVAKDLLESGRAFDQHGKITDAAIGELADAGYLKILIPEEYGGFGMSIPAALQVQEELAAIHPIWSLFVSVHGMIGAVNPLRLYGTEEQKQRWFPQLAKTSSAFALTEPGAGSDVKNVKTRAVKKGDYYEVTGEKMFITNAWYNRIVSLVALVPDEKGKESPRVFIIKTPAKADETFRIKTYGLHALKNAYNVGIVFKNYRIPAEDLLAGNGLEIAFNGLNAARVAVDVNSLVGIQELISSMLPWVRRRVTFHKPIGERQLVDARLAESLALAMGCRALWRYCSAVLQEGFRGEAECIVAKTFGSDSAFQVVSDQYWKTIGGRVLFKGDVGGDFIHDIGAERIYEGENSMLLMKLFGTLVKGPQKKYLEPMIKNLAKRGVKRLNQKNPVHLFLLALYGAPHGLSFIARAVWFYSKGLFGHSDIRGELKQAGISGVYLDQAAWAIRELQRMSLVLNLAMFKYQTGLINQQNRMVALAERVQQLFVMAITAIQASRETDEQLQKAALLLCEDLKRKVLAPDKSDAYYRHASKLGHDMYSNGCDYVAHIDHAHFKGDYNDDTHELLLDTVEKASF